MAIVSDTSPLILLAKIGRLDLLQRLFGEVLIPPEVGGEIAPAAGRRQEAHAILAASWIRINEAVGNALPAPSVPHRLGPGEAAAIRLALAYTPRPVVLLDDLDGRRAAERLGIQVTGTGGVVVLAKQMGLISEVRPLLLQLQSAGMYLAGDVLQALLAAAGESSSAGDEFAAE